MIYVAPGRAEDGWLSGQPQPGAQPKARADSIPGLEILADDVRCTHGATVGKLEQEPLFYLRSRGIPQAEAERLVVEGFFDPIMQRIPFEGVRERFQQAILEKMGVKRCKRLIQSLRAKRSNLELVLRISGTRLLGANPIPRNDQGKTKILTSETIERVTQAEYLLVQRGGWNPARGRLKKAWLDVAIQEAKSCQDCTLRMHPIPTRRSRLATG